MGDLEEIIVSSNSIIISAEKVTQEIISEVQPTDKSEGRRSEVIDYVQRLIRTCLGCQVKIVKCIVQNIVVDISINQIGGLCTLCFLEQVDRLIAKDHLFKRSIILIKAWCYYESRILGAHHALISTYALETLVLYIFHLFHSMLDGPLAVLYKFLDYFSKFDWDNYCISLTGPVPLSSLPEIIAETPENGGNGLLLSGDFLRNCIDKFHVPSREAETNPRTFQEKHLNIVDPLKENNNLGRSVSKGNFYRIKSAFTYGARKLGRILLQSEDSIAFELHNFFLNTLERHGHGERPDVQDSAGSLPNHYHYSPESDLSDYNGNYVPEHSRTYPDVASCSGAVSTDIAKVGSRSVSENGNHKHTLDGNGSVVDLEEAGNLKGSQVQGLKIYNDIPGRSASDLEVNVSARGFPYHAPHLFFSNSHDEMVKSPSNQLKNSETSFKVSQASIDNGFVKEENLMVSNGDSVDPKAINYSMKCGMDHEVNSYGSPTYTHSLSDLTGDYETHVNCLRYGRWWFEYGAGIPVLPIPLMLPHYQMKMPYEAMLHPPHFKRNGYSHGNVNDMIQNPSFCAMNPLVIPPAVAVGLEDMPKPRGTGTYFPNSYQPRQVLRPSVAKLRNQSTRSPRTNVRSPTFPEPFNHDRYSCGSPRSDEPSPKHGFSDVQHPLSRCGKGHLTANGSVALSEGFIELGSADYISASSLERSRQQKYSSTSSPSSPVYKPVFSKDDRFSMRSAYRLKDEDDFPPLSNRGDPVLE
ncbi:hypothetical protein Leryth_022406 [Lithospermum erythrorhizon]|nr:hypothetical protein Leryth_022406 [Lithospermum erythrorhizon]